MKQTTGINAFIKLFLLEIYYFTSTGDSLKMKPTMPVKLLVAVYQ